MLIFLLQKIAKLKLTISNANALNKFLFLIQEIFVNPSLDNPSDLTSVTLFRERDTFKYNYMYFSLDFRHFDIRHPSLFLRNGYNTLHRKIIQ